MNKQATKPKKVVLAYSGGLDTSIIIPWLKETYGCEVIAMIGDVGQQEDLEAAKKKALATGASSATIEDLREEFVRDYIWPTLRAGAVYEHTYLLGTSMARPVIAKRQAEIALQLGADGLSHGCTGKGNDQVRIEATVATLAPELKVIAPVRSWQMGREEEIAYAREHGIPIKSQPGEGTESAPPYSIDDNLWGRSSEGRWIEDLKQAPEDDVFQLVTRPEDAPEQGEVVELEFEQGVPVALNGTPLGLVDLLEGVAAIGARHGVGIVDHIEDRIVGLKVRDIYEVPAAAIVLPAHQDLERLVCTIHENQFKPQLDRQWAYLVYAGLWLEPLRADLDAYMERVNERVSGTVGLKLYKGHVRVVTRSSANAIYDAGLASFAQSGGHFSQAASPGFIELWSLQSRMAWRLRNQQ